MSLFHFCFFFFFWRPWSLFLFQLAYVNIPLFLCYRCDIWARLSNEKLSIHRILTNLRSMALKTASDFVFLVWLLFFVSWLYFPTFSLDTETQKKKPSQFGFPNSRYVINHLHLHCEHSSACSVRCSILFMFQQSNWKFMKKAESFNVAAINLFTFAEIHFRQTEENKSYFFLFISPCQRNAGHVRVRNWIQYFDFIKLSSFNNTQIVFCH